MDDYSPDKRRLLAAFGSAVRARRQALKLSQEALALRAGIHRTYISDVERGARNVALGNIAKLASGLDLDLAALLAETAQHLDGSRHSAAPRGGG